MCVRVAEFDTSPDGGTPPVAVEIEVDNIDQTLAKSGILEKHLEIEGIKKNIDALKILVEAQYESLKEFGEKQDKTLQYVF